jgi:type III secretory pathway component EscV
MLHIVNSFSRMGEENAFAVLARATELQRQGKDIINLGIGQPDFQTPEHIVEAAIKALRDGSSSASDDLIAPLYARAIDAAQRDHAIAEGFLTVDAGTVVATHLNQLLGDRPAALLGPDEVRAIVEGVRERASSLIEAIHPQPLSLGALTRLLRALLEDGISIAHPLPILAALGDPVLSVR